MLNGLLEAYVKALLESDEDLLGEFAGAGGVAGMTGPLGAAPTLPPEPKVIRKRHRRNK